MVEFLTRDMFDEYNLVAVYYTEEIKSKVFGDTCVIC